MSVLGSHAFMHHAEKNKALHPVCHSYGHPVRRSSLGERCQKTQERESESERKEEFCFHDGNGCPQMVLRQYQVPRSKLSGLCDVLDVPLTIDH